MRGRGVRQRRGEEDGEDKRDSCGERRGNGKEMKCLRICPPTKIFWFRF
jgi:hypothetical protein